MKLMHSNRRAALTLIEVLVVIAAFVVMAAILIPGEDVHKRKAKRINCINNLKEISLAFKIWSNDSTADFPTQRPEQRGGARELGAAGNVAGVFLVMSNELTIPRILICPADTDHQAARSFTSGLNNQNISYFIGLDATEANPDSILMGDDNFEIKRTEVKSAVLQLTTNTPIAWTSGRHHFAGNIALADGSARPVTTAELTKAINKQTVEGDTNRFRWAVP
jgi:hypothetical protein